MLFCILIFSLKDAYERVLKHALSFEKILSTCSVTSKAEAIVAGVIREKKDSCRNSIGDSIGGSLID